MITISKLKKGGYKFENEDFSVKVFYTGGKLWISKKNIRKLFCIKKEQFSKTINEIFLGGDHDLETEVQQVYNNKLDKNESFYNLDIIISLGYRTHGFEETKFLIQANRELKNNIESRPSNLRKFTLGLKHIIDFVKPEQNNFTRKKIIY